MSPVRVGEAFADIYPDLRKFGASLKRQMAQFQPALNRQMDQLSKTGTRSFDDIGRSVDEVTVDVDRFGDTAQQSAEQTGRSFLEAGSSFDSVALDADRLSNAVQGSFDDMGRSVEGLQPNIEQVAVAQENLAAANVKSTRAALGLKQAQQQLAAIQKDSAGDADKLALAQLKVDEAQVRVSQSTRNADRAQRTLNSSMADGEQGSSGFSHSLSGVSSRMSQFSSSLGGGTRNAQLFGGTLSLIKWPTFIQGANLAAAGISGLSAAAVGAVAALAPLSGLLATIPAGLTAVGSAVGTASLGLFGVGDALTAMSEAATASSSATGDAAAESEALAEAMEKLSPAGRAFVRVLFDMKPKLDALRETAQAGLLPGLGQAIQRLGNQLFPILSKAVAETAKTMGSLAEEGAALVTSGPWKRDFATLLSGNSRLLENMGRIAFNLGDAFRHIAVAGQPLAFWLGRVAEKASAAFAAFFGEARRSGDLAEFFDRTREATQRLFSIFGNLGQVLGDVLGAGQAFGAWLLRQLDQVTEGWADFTGSIEGQNALKQWFEDAKPVVIALGRLIGDIAKMFGGMATSKGLPQLINQLRTQLLPVINDIFETSSGKLIPALVDLATNFAKVFKVFGTEHGFMLTFVNTLTAIFGAIAKVTRASPALAAGLATVGTSAGILAAVKFTGTITGLNRVSSLLGTATGKLLRFTTGAESTSGALALLGTRLKAIGVAGALAAIASPVGIAVAAIAALVGAFVVLYTQSEKFRNAVGQLVSALGRALAPIVNELRAGLAAMGFEVSSLGAFVEDLGNKLAPVIRGLADLVSLISKSQVLGQVFRAFLGPLGSVASVMGALGRDTGKLALAEDELAAAQVDARFKQEALTAARQDARLALEDMRDSAKQGAISEARAEIGLATARENLIRLEQSGTASSRELRSARLDVRQAELDLANAREAQIDNQKKLSKAERQGIEGTKAVIEARRDKIDADKKSAKSEENLAKVLKESGNKTLALWERISKAAKDLWKGLDKAWDGIKDSIGDAASKARELVAKAWEGMRDKIADVWGTIKDVTGRSWDSIKNLFANSLETLKRIWGNAWDTIKTVLGNAWDAIKRAVQNGADAVVRFMKNLPGRIRQGIGNLSKLLYDKGVSLIGGFLKGIVRGAGEIAAGIGDAVQNAVDKITDVVVPDFLGDGFGAIGTAQGGSAARMANMGIAAIGAPFSVSGYRSPAENAAVGGATNSYHMDAANPAQDISGSPAAMLKLAQWLVGKYGATAREIIHTPLGYSMTHGARVPPIAPEDHYSHVHVADKGGVFKGPGMVGIGPITETVFQPARKVSELVPQTQELVPHIVRLISDLPEKLGAVWSKATQVLADKINGADGGTSTTVETAISELTKDFSRLISTETNRSTDVLTQTLQSSSLSTSEQVQGPGVVGTRGVAETVLQPVREVSKLLQTEQFVTRIVEQIVNLPEKLGGSGEALRTVADEIKVVGLAAGEAVKVVISALTKELPNSVPSFGRGVHIADRGGVFQGPGMVGIGDITETVFQPARKVSALPQTQEFIPRIVQLIGDLPEKLRDVSSEATRVFVDKISGSRDSDTVRTVASELIKEFSNLISTEVSRSTNALTQILESSSLVTSDRSKDIRFADKGGVFQGPGVVGIGGVTETVFQPARKVSELPETGQLVSRIAELISSLPKTLGDLWSQAFRAFANEIRGIGGEVGDAVRAALSGITKELSNLIPRFKGGGRSSGRGSGEGRGINVNRSAQTPIQMFEALSEAVPGKQMMTSGHRPEATTPSGDISLHSIEPPWNAVDISGDNLLAMAHAAVTAFGGKAREIIYTPLGFSIKDGTRVAPITAADHHDHLHIADKGGVFEGPGVVGIGGITETVFQPARKVSELPQSEGFITRIADLISKLPEKLGVSWGQVLRAFAEEIRGVGGAVGDAVRVAISGLTKELSNFVSSSGERTGKGFGEGLGIEVNRSARTPTQMFQALSEAMPGQQFKTSGNRPKAVAPSGKASFHALDPPWNAIDIGGDNLMAVAQGAVAAFGNKAKEIVYTPLGFSIKDGERVAPIAGPTHYDHVHIADKGGVFRGPGMVGVGGITETVFQPARKVSELPQSGQMVARFKGPVKIDLVNGEAYFEEILLEHDNYQAYRGRAY